MMQVHLAATRTPMLPSALSYHVTFLIVVFIAGLIFPTQTQRLVERLVVEPVEWCLGVANSFWPGIYPLLFLVLAYTWMQYLSFTWQSTAITGGQLTIDLPPALLTRRRR